MQNGNDGVYKYISALNDESFNVTVVMLGFQYLLGVIFIVL